MGLKERFLDKMFFFDTAPFIYFIEENLRYHQRLLELFQLNDSGTIKFQTSVCKNTSFYAQIAKI